MACDHPVPSDGEVLALEVPGADCPWCLNHTLDRLRQVDGVTDVHASMGGSCIQVVHHGADVPSLLGLVRTTLHGTAISSNETEVVAIDPRPSTVRCTHRSHRWSRRLHAGAHLT